MRHRPERHEALRIGVAGGGGDADRKLVERAQIGADALRQPHDDLDAAVAAQDLPGLGAGERGVHRRLHVGDVESVARGGRAIDLDREGGKTAGLLDLDVGRPANAAEDAGDAPRVRRQHVEVVAEHLDGDVAAHAGDQLVEAVLDGLGELVDVAGQALELGLEVVNQLVLGLPGIGPFTARLQDDDHVARARRHRVVRDVRGADEREHRCDLRELGDRSLDVAPHREALLQASAGDVGQDHEQVLLVERRDELGAEAGRDHTAQREEHERPRQHRAPPPQRPPQRGG